MISEYEIQMVIEGEDVALPIEYYRQPISTSSMQLTEEEKEYLYPDEIELWNFITLGIGKQPKVYITDLLRKLSSERRGIGT